MQAVSDEHREQLTAMAETWDTLALERERIKPDDYFAPRAEERPSGDLRRKPH